MWLLSNFVESGEHAQHLINHTICQRVIDMCSSSNVNIKKEALWTLTNVLSGAEPTLVKQMADYDDGAGFKLVIKFLERPN